VKRQKRPSLTGFHLSWEKISGAGERKTVIVSKTNHSAWCQTTGLGFPVANAAAGTETMVIKIPSTRP
jgi:hypothetical protein